MSNPFAHHPSALRNRIPIFDAISPILSKYTSSISDRDKFTSLELASGTGAHEEYFAPKLPKFEFQPSEYVQTKEDFNNNMQGQSVLDILTHNLSGFSNILNPLPIDASKPPSDWGLQGRKFDMVYVSNLFHISPIEVMNGAIKGASTHLHDNGIMLVYGPFKVEGKFTTKSNEDFDENLKQRNARWGYRDVEKVKAVGEKHGLKMKEVIQMPANNLLLHMIKM